MERSGAVPCRAVLCRAVLPAPPGPRPLPVVGGVPGRGCPPRVCPVRPGSAPQQVRPQSCGSLLETLGAAAVGQGAGMGLRVPFRSPLLVGTDNAAQLGQRPAAPPARSQPCVNLPLLLIPVRRSALSLLPQLAQPRHHRPPHGPAPAGPGSRAGALGILRRIFSGWDNRESQLSNQDDGSDTETLAGDEGTDNAMGAAGCGRTARLPPSLCSEAALPVALRGPRARAPPAHPCAILLGCHGNRHVRNPSRHREMRRAVQRCRVPAVQQVHGTGDSEDPLCPCGAETSAAALQGRASPAERR